MHFAFSAMVARQISWPSTTPLDTNKKHLRKLIMKPLPVSAAKQCSVAYQHSGQRSSTTVTLSKKASDSGQWCSEVSIAC